MTFQESVKVCFSKYAEFEGRASRSEYWWFFLFLVLGSVLTSFIHYYVSIIFTLGTIVPALSAASRRLHDTHRSGWWQLISLIPFIGSIVLIVFLAQESKDGPPDSQLAKA